MSKSLGATLIGMLFCPIVLFAPRRILIFASAGVAYIFILYPVLRGAGLIPIDDIMNFATSISEDRARSLAFRINYEELLLARAQERPLFGWGGWGRSLYVEGAQAIPDGEWIIVLGRHGWAGFLGLFGLLVFPVVLLSLRWRRDGIGMETAIIAVVLTASAVDLLPNSGLTPDKWLLAGALWGRLELGRLSVNAPADPAPLNLRPQHRRQAEAPLAAARQNTYTRQVRRIKR